MVTITRRTIKGSTYYYLEHTIRINGAPRKRDLFLGKVIPKDIEVIKKDFARRIFKDQYVEKLGKIKANFSKECLAMPQSAREKYLNYFLVKFTYDTNRIEGSTLSYKDTARILDQGIAPFEKSLDDVKEAESHKRVFLEVINEKRDFSRNLVLYWHKLLFTNTKKDIAGKIRNNGVKVSGSKSAFPLPVEIHFLLDEFFTWYQKEKKGVHPVELSALVHLKFVSIHPFSDGNGRMSRLLMNSVLHKHGYPMLNIKYISRSGYYNALERSQVSKNEMVFVHHLIKSYMREYKKYL